MNKKLNIIKLMHTTIWLLYVIIILYIAFAGITGRFDVILLISIILLLLEFVVLIVNKGICPFTTLAYKYSDKHEVGFDIFLPKLVAKYNKVIFGSIFLLGIILIIFKLLIK